VSSETKAGEFCRRGGKVEGAAESPATLAGHAAGDARPRLRIAALATAGVWAADVGYAALSGTLDAMVIGAASAVALAALALVGLSYRGSDRALALSGALFLVGGALAIALVEHHVGLGPGLSWSAVWVALTPLVVPCSPKHTLIKALVVATASPLAFGMIAITSADAWPSALALAGTFAPVYLGALVAYAGARLLAKIGGQLERARSVGRYELIRRLGAGGMGEVWEARHRMLARPVALKVISPGNGDVQSRRARFEREAKATASLRSPHTVQLYDFGTTEEGSLYYAMELLEGLDLEELVRRHGALPPERVVSLLLQALDSLEEAHRMGLVHRDIKPANLHLGRQGLRHDFLKVLDFGLVKIAASRDALGPTLTADGHISGTPAYLAPETITGGEVDGRADIYALGCVAYWLLTGQRVFPADDALRAAVLHVTEAPVPPSQRGAELEPDLEAVILAMLEKDPVRRPDAASLREMLEACVVEPWSEDDAAAWWSSHAPRATLAEPARRLEPRAAPMMIGHA
jgi:serine/threonine-protein kinase